MVGQEVHAPPTLLGAEARGELGDERGHVAVGVGGHELGREHAQAPEVGLARDLLVGVGVGLRVVAEAFVAVSTATCASTLSGRRSAASTERGPGLRRNAPSRTWYGIAAAANASSNGSERALIR